MIRGLWGLPALLAIAAFVAVFTFVVTALIPRGPDKEVDLPVFDQEDVDIMKQAFLDYLRPIVHYHNEKISRERQWLLDATESKSPGWFDRRRLRSLAEQYHVDMDTLGIDETIVLLKRRVDTIPESLVLIQAAKESGWGRSRFAQNGNALFGERCHQEGCGMVPGALGSSASFEVQTFETVGESVASYLRNLNTHERYIGLRKAREQLRQRDAEVTGSELAGHLNDYSERRDEYVAEIRAMIRQNNLE